MGALRMNLAQWKWYHARLKGRCHEAGLRGARAAGLRVVALMVKRTREAEPASDHGAVGAVNTGALARSWRSVPNADGTRIVNLQPYWAVVEYGRRPNSTPPPRAPIEAWLRRRLKLKPAAARSAAYVVARAIGRRGLRGRRILTHPAVTAQIEAILHDEIRRALRQAIAKPP